MRTQPLPQWNNFLRHYDELKWLYLELYQNWEDIFQSLCRSMYGFYEGRNASLKSIDFERLENPERFFQFHKPELVEFILPSDFLVLPFF
ncbi:hypothetical protein VSQ48_02995 [Candidatus Ventrimonas sp. KK005]|nr:hypothetical protein [Clostridiaceae bacterium]